MRTLLLALLFCSPVFGADTFVSTAGSDSNNCLSPQTPCRTIARGVEAAYPEGNVQLYTGTYQVSLNLSHRKFITLSGDCSNYGNVVLQVAGGSVGFFVQDHATLIIRCMYVTATGSASVLARTRQFAIFDYDRTFIGSFPGGIHFDAQEKSKINCMGATNIYGGANTHINVVGGSSYSGSCAVTLVGNPAFSYYAVISHRSLADFSGASFSGTASGQKHIVYNGTLTIGGLSLPGNVAGLIVPNSFGFVD